MNPADDLLDAIRAGQARGLVPPLAVVGPDGLVRESRSPAGDRDAAAVGRLLARPAFSILIETLARLTEGCAKLTSDFVDPEIVRPLNGALFGPIVQAVFLACLGGEESAQRGPAEIRTQDFLHFLKVFFERLDADRPGLVTGLTACPAETHNGGRRVLRVDLSDGRRLAYKARPTGTEEQFLGLDRSVFALLNALPPRSGPIQLPTMRIDGRGDYAWHEWIEPPAAWGELRDGLSGTRIERADAEAFWHRAGSLTAACFGFGLTDLFEGNLLVGIRPRVPEPLYYPVDLEIAFAPVQRLSETGLVPRPGSPDHHVGLETEPRLCAADGPGAVMIEQATAELALWRRDRPMARTETRTVVADSTGQVGYPPYLPTFLRGMFDAWTLICSNLPGLRELLDEPVTTRVLLRPTAEYGDMLDSHLYDGAPWPAGLASAEIEQLRRFDVPYFVRSSGGGPLRYCDPDRDRWIAVGADLPPVQWAERLTLAGLGPALMDAVADAGTTGCVLDDSAGVRVAAGSGGGEVAFEWAEAGRRVCYRWQGTKLSVRLYQLAELESVAARLLRLDAVDAAWRARWVDSHFSDAEAGAKLRRLTDTAAEWLGQVIAEHGWPDQLLVGAAAADAASRLIQHLEEHLDLQRSGLAGVAEAVALGKLPGRHLAYLTDAVRLAEDRPQVYGTKFVPVDGRLEPWPMEAPASVDARRSELGLEPLDQYAAAVRQRFSLEAS